MLVLEVNYSPARRCDWLSRSHTLET